MILSTTSHGLAFNLALARIAPLGYRRCVDPSPSVSLPCVRPSITLEGERSAGRSGSPQGFRARMSDTEWQSRRAARQQRKRLQRIARRAQQLALFQGES